MPPPKKKFFNLLTSKHQAKWLWFYNHKDIRMPLLSVLCISFTISIHSFIIFQVLLVGNINLFSALNRININDILSYINFIKTRGGIIIPIVGPLSLIISRPPANSLGHIDLLNNPHFSSYFLNTFPHSGSELLFIRLPR